MAAKLAPDIAIDIECNPVYTSRSGPSELDRLHHRIVIDTNLLQSKAQYGAATATNVAAHRKVAHIPSGIARMY